MQVVVRPLFLLHADADLQDRLSRLPGQHYVLTRVAGWGQLREALRRSPPTALSIVDPFASAKEPGEPAEDLYALLAAFPSATVLAALPVRPQDSAVLQTLFQWGVADAVDLVRERTPAALAHRLGRVQGRTVERLLRRAVPDGMPGRSRALLGVAAEVVARGGQATDLAQTLGVTARTVSRWCARADLPYARQLLPWLRVLLAADLLDDPGRPIQAVARACGYATAGSLRSALLHRVGATPQELREAGAFQRVAGAFRAELSALRERSRVEGRPERVWLH